MIVFYTKYNVIKTFSITELMKYAFTCINGMRNVPEEFKAVKWNGESSGEWKHERNLLSYEISGEASKVAFRIAIVDQNDELWTTDIVMNEMIHEIQLRLAREKKIVSAEYDQSFNVPYMFKKLIRDGIGDLDVCLPVSDKPIYVSDENINIMANIINRKMCLKLPVIYVSHPFSSDEYQLDVEELAKDMAGSAHVMVEQDSSVSVKLRNLTDSKNAYNGAIDVFYNDAVFRYMRFPDISPNQYRYKISHSIYSRMAMRNIDDESSLSTLRLQNKVKKLDSTAEETQRLRFKIDKLQAKNNEYNEYFELFSEEIKMLEKRINELENVNFELRNKNDSLTKALNRKTDNSELTINLECRESPFYEDEIKRMILAGIRLLISSYGTDEKKRRDYHVLKSIIDNNSVSDAGDIIKNRIFQILRKNNMGKNEAYELRSLGFELQHGGHSKYVFHGDDRYIITLSSTPGDSRDGENIAHEAMNLLFGRMA